MATPTLETRVSELEKKVAHLLGEETEDKKLVPWWEEIRGMFKDDPAYTEAMRLGREWRASQRLEDEDTP